VALMVGTSALPLGELTPPVSSAGYVKWPP
jgi:hypothetical protein